MVKISDSFWKIGVSVLFLLFIVFWINPARLVEKLNVITPPVLAVMILAVMMGQLINSLSQYWGLRAIRPLSFSQVFPHSLASWITELFLPGKLGVFSLMYFLKKEGVQLGESTSVILMLRMLNAGFALFLALIGIGKFLDVPGVWSAVAALIVILAGIFVAFFTAPGRDFFRKRILGKYSVHFTGFGTGLNKIIHRPQTIGGLILLSGLFFLVQGTTTYAMFLLSGYPVDFLTMLSAIALVQILIQVPITINGWGIREGLMVLFFARMGVPGEVTLLLSAASVSVAYVMALLLSWTVIREIPPQSEWMKIVSNPSMGEKNSGKK